MHLVCIAVVIRWNDYCFFSICERRGLCNVLFYFIFLLILYHVLLLLLIQLLSVFFYVLRSALVLIVMIRHFCWPRRSWWGWLGESSTLSSELLTLAACGTVRREMLDGELFSGRIRLHGGCLVWCLAQLQRHQGLSAARRTSSRSEVADHGQQQ